ncbi:hypothetical protein [Zestomonas carbonaria]|uniref:Uncharacterized protein n=1 Tax=Zestomonas carbonaria TaxID=2762745 RepID=A0A7U7EQY8_9GAMM|nr:hypothetical protein [Pseudomonas carbonaria]CAD5109562.1 hypothetical protein PSEWESI4_03867 [Pseudomonas carbonaria]
MLIRDRVYCDLCLAPMGQVYGQPADGSGWAAAFGMAPDYAVCPDCLEAECEPASEAAPEHN